MFHYLDNAATTPVRPEAVQAAAAAMEQGWGNPSAQYEIGRQAAGQVRQWRADVAAALGCAPEEFVFTSCGTEGDNWAIFGAADLNRRKGKHIVTTAYEHAAVLEPCRQLERRGYEVTYLAPDREGNISVDDLTAALRPDTVLVSMMLVNNELGSLLPVAEAVKAVRRSGAPALFHCDAVQGFLKVPFTPARLGVDLLSVSGHKIHGPKGVGGLYIRRGLRLPPFILGGGQEGGLRSGTEATGQLAAFAAAARLGRATLEQDLAHMAGLKQYALEQLTGTVPGLVRVGGGTAPHILSISLPGYKSEVLVRFLSDRGVYVSSGSACHRGKASHVYASLGLPKKVLDGVLRVSFSYDTTREDVDALVRALTQAQKELFTSLS